MLLTDTAVCAHVCVCVRARACVCVRARACVCVRACVRVRVRVCVWCWRVGRWVIWVGKCVCVVWVRVAGGGVGRYIGGSVLYVRTCCMISDNT